MLKSLLEILLSSLESPTFLPPLGASVFVMTITIKIQIVLQMFQNVLLPASTNIEKQMFVPTACIGSCTVCNGCQLA